MKFITQNNRLIRIDSEETVMPKTSPLSLDTIRVDMDIQPRIEIDEETVDDYAEIYKRDGADHKFPPLRVFKDETGDEPVYWLSRGFHRYCAAQQAGRSSHDCEIHTGGRREAWLDAMGDNWKHGRRRTAADKRKIVNSLLDDPKWGKESQKKIAAQAEVSRTFVQTVILERKPKAPITPQRPDRGASPSKSTPPPPSYTDSGKQTGETKPPEDDTPTGDDSGDTSDEEDPQSKAEREHPDGESKDIPCPNCKDSKVKVDWWEGDQCAICCHPWDQDTDKGTESAYATWKTLIEKRFTKDVTLRSILNALNPSDAELQQLAEFPKNDQKKIIRMADGDRVATVGAAIQLHERVNSGDDAPDEDDDPTIQLMGLAKTIEHARNALLKYRDEHGDPPRTRKVQHPKNWFDTSIRQRLNEVQMALKELSRVPWK